jgi:Neuraminidase-like domain/ABC toxin N-terminal region
MELQVHPSVINSKQWEWMQRYRVWEANRKIFLFPENWLEPEFRDDKTHLFAELEGALLQGDVSSDLVEDAFLNYLKKLDELARLDIVAMHLEDDPDPTLRTLHVIGRTYSQPHKYFYRRYAHQMWTAWQPVTAEIESDHLAPVVWRDRLYLFWVTFMEKPEQPLAPAFSPLSTVFESARGNIAKYAGGAHYVGKGLPGIKDEQKLTDMTLSDVTSGAMASAGKRTIEAQLHWSEYLQGEWSTRESGGFDAPVVVVTGVSNFDSKGVFIHVSKEPFENGEERGVYIHLGGAINQAFYLAGRNSTPERASYGKGGPKPANPYSADTVRATRYSGSGALKVTFKRRITIENGKPPVETFETPSILAQVGSYTILPCDNDITLGPPATESLGATDPVVVAQAIERGLPEIASLMKPLFYQDNANNLFIEPNVEERTIEEWQEWVTRTPQPEPKWVLPDRLGDFLKPMVPRPKLPVLVDPGDPIWDLPIEGESLVKMQPGQDWLVNPVTGLHFDGEVIGPAGRTGLAVVQPVGAVEALADGGIPINVHPGSKLASGSTVVAPASDALNRAGLVQTGMLNIVGGSGFNSALAHNFDALNRSGFGVRKVGSNSIDH